MEAPAARRTLYPEIEAFRTRRLRVSDAHELYFEESRPPDLSPSRTVRSRRVLSKRTHREAQTEAGAGEDDGCGVEFIGKRGHGGGAVW